MARKMTAKQAAAFKANRFVKGGTRAKSLGAKGGRKSPVKATGKKK